MKGKNSFTAYSDWIETFEALDDEQAGKLVKHIFRYVNDQDPEPPDVLTKAVFASIKTTLKRDLEKWRSKVEINRENGAKGGRPKNPKNPVGFYENPTKAKKGDSVRDRDSVSDKEVIKESIKKSRFAPPSLLEVQNYIEERAYTVNAESFMAYYESNGWKVGKNPMKDWKAALRTWQSREKEKGPAKKEKELTTLEKIQATNEARRRGLINFKE